MKAKFLQNEEKKWTDGWTDGRWGIYSKTSVRPPLKEGFKTLKNRLESFLFFCPNFYSKLDKIGWTDGRLP